MCAYFWMSPWLRKVPAGLGFPRTPTRTVGGVSITGAYWFLLTHNPAHCLFISKVGERFHVYGVVGAITHGRSRILMPAASPHFESYIAVQALC